MDEELKEFIKSKREPIMSCKDLTKHFIGRHKLIPVYLLPTFEKEFNYKMVKIEELQQENKKQKEVIAKIRKRCETEINASNHYLKNHNSQQELCHKVAHQRILDILKGMK